MSTTTRPRSTPAPHSRDALDDYRRSLLEDAETDYQRGHRIAGSSEQIEEMHERARRLGAKPRPLPLDQNPHRRLTPMTTYRLRNNTDHPEHFVTQSERKAKAFWNKIKPRPDAGNRYVASFQRLCACGEWADARPDAIAAHCNKDV